MYRMPSNLMPEPGYGFIVIVSIMLILCVVVFLKGRTK